MYKFILLLLVVKIFSFEIKAEPSSCGRHAYCSNDNGLYFTAGEEIAFLDFSNKFKIQKILLPEEIMSELPQNASCQIHCDNEQFDILVKHAFQYKLKNNIVFNFMKKYPRPLGLPARSLVTGLTKELYRNDKYKIILNYDHTESHVKTKYGDITHFYKTTLLKIDLKTGKKIDEHLVADERRNESVH